MVTDPSIEPTEYAPSSCPEAHRSDVQYIPGVNRKQAIVQRESAQVHQERQ